MSRVSIEIPQATPAHPIQDATPILTRLVSEWRVVRVKLGLSTTARVLDVAERLGVDRGTAQRLCRIGRLTRVASCDVEHFPGKRGWVAVMAGVEKALGAESPGYQTLALACDHFCEWLRANGGSRSAAMRRAVLPEAPAPHPATAGDDNPRARWVQAAAEMFGYIADVRIDIQMARETPGSSPPHIDLATVNGLKSCHGTPGAMPLAFTRTAYTVDHRVIAGGGGTDPRSFYVLASLTSKPAPAILSTGDAFRQTIFVEPQWASMTRPLDLALLHEERAAFPSPWGTAHEWLEFSTINRHPCRRLLIERIVSRDIDAKCSVALRVFRSHAQLAHDEPWFDRIPDDTPVERVGAPAEAIDREPFPGYAAALSESLMRLRWDAGDMVVYRAVIENPIPLATYTVMFDRVRE